jgi:hypothetical protein
MPEAELPNLSLPALPTGTHGTEWDLGLLLFRGATSSGRRKATDMVSHGLMGAHCPERIALFVKMHATLKANLVRGQQRSYRSVRGQLSTLFGFVKWVESNELELSLDTIKECFFSWVEHLIYRYRVKKDLKHDTAYWMVSMLGSLVGKALDYTHSEPGRALIRQTRMRAPKARKRVLGSAADKENLTKTFACGHLLTDVCNVLTADVVRGTLPIHVPLRDGMELLIKGGLRNVELDPMTLSRGRDRDRSMRVRAPLLLGERAGEHRPSVVNTRIECEYLIFIAQTGMNATQAGRTPVERYRWQTEGDDLKAFRVYKGRRSGEAIFRCFRAYREHLERYVAWLEELDLNADCDLLFPFIYHTGKMPSEYDLRLLSGAKNLCEQAGIRLIKPRQLRKTRVNWLLRRHGNAQLTAEQVAHTEATLLRVYEQPHHQRAASEIVRYHAATELNMAPPGPGVCVRTGVAPELLKDALPHAPPPDCVSAEGCLSCVFHRDVMSEEYCWKLTSHRRLKVLELGLYKPPKTAPPHPADATVKILDAKLSAIGAGSEIRGIWVREAKDKVREGRYHPVWDGHIKLLEIASESF